jgi:hypothetical protein
MSQSTRMTPFLADLSIPTWLAGQAGIPNPVSHLGRFHHAVQIDLGSPKHFYRRVINRF